jgi:hypothetical protein
VPDFQFVERFVCNRFGARLPPAAQVARLFAAAGCLSLQQPAGSVLLNDDLHAEKTLRQCLGDASGTTRYTNSEAYAAVDPRESNHVIAVWQTRSANGSVIQWSRSTDGGKTWTHPHAAAINGCAGGPLTDASRTSDPWVTLGPDGRVYLSAIAWRPNPGNGPDLVSALVVVASQDGGGTWERPMVAARAPTPAVAYDNLAIIADPTRPATLYATTTRAEWPDTLTYFGRLGFTRSTDGGRTWTPIRSITAAVNGERIGAPQIVVDPRSGRLYAVYTRQRGRVSSIGLKISDDRGDTWSAENVAAPHIAGGRARNPVTGAPFVLATDIVQAVVTPTNGRLVIAYADGRRAPGQRDGVSVVWSANGIRWSTPLALSDGGAETAWLPAIAVTKKGDIGVSWYSANFTPGEKPGARLFIERLRSTADGLVRLDRVVLDTMNLAWPGDYQGLVAAGGCFIAVYGRDGDIAASARTKCGW